MREVVLGSLEFEHRHQINELLEDEKPRLAAGRYSIVGQADGDGRARRSGLVGEIGRNQWAVYMLNERQLQKAVSSEYARAVEPGLIQELAWAERLEPAERPDAQILGYRLAQQGVAPSDAAHVRRELHLDAQWPVGRGGSTASSAVDGLARELDP